MFKASATSLGEARTQNNLLVTSTASATAESDISLDDAYNKALEIARNEANSSANNDANVIYQSKQISTNKLLLSESQQENLSSYLEKLPISNNNITMDRVINSFNSFKRAVWIVHYISNKIMENSEKIKAAGEYASTLSPIFGESIELMQDDFWITTINNKNYKVYLMNSYPIYNNKYEKEIYNYNQTNGLTNFSYNLKKNIELMNEAYTSLTKKYPNQKTYYYISIAPWDYSLSLKFNVLIPCHIYKDQYISVGCRIMLDGYLSENISNGYNNFVSSIANELEKLNSSEWKGETIWSYENPVTFPNSKCLYSEFYPYWTGKNVNDCYIRGSDEDIPSIVTSINKDLWSSYPILSTGNIVFSTYTLNQQSFLAIIKITGNYENGEKKLYFSNKSINVNNFFVDFLKYQGDTSITGSLNVKTFNDEDVIKTNNELKTTSFYNKVGINQDPQFIKGLLDIDNVSYSLVVKTLDDFVTPLIYSYDALQSIKLSLKYGTNSINLLTEYKKNIFLFKVPLNDEINYKDISFLSTPNEGAFSNKEMENNSFLKIINIVKEIKNIISDEELNSTINKQIFSFTEIMNDTLNWYLCSLRCIVKQSSNIFELYFVSSSLNIDSIMNNKSLKNDFINVAETFSTCNKLVNLSICLIQNKKTYNNLLEGNSVGSKDENNLYFSDLIDKKYRRYQGKGLYIWAYEEERMVQLLHEQFPYFITKPLDKLYLPNNNYNVGDVATKSHAAFKKKYGNRLGCSFINSYKWTKGPKFSVMNYILLQGMGYVVGCGFNLVDIISESIVAKGDNTITGNLDIIDSDTNNQIFSVDTYNDICFSLYPLGLGTNDPKSKLDIKNGGLQNIINCTDEITSIINNTNKNISLLINAKSDTEFESIINKNFYNYTTNQKHIQSDKYYYSILQIPPNYLDVGDWTIIYNHQFPSFNYKKVNSLKSAQHSDIVDIIISNTEKKILSGYIEKKYCCLITYKWRYGEKIGYFLYFENNNQLYALGLGIDLGIFSIDTLDKNIQSYFQILTFNIFLIQDIYDRMKNKEKNNINSKFIQTYKEKNLQLNNPKKIYEISISLTDIRKMSVNEIDYDTLEVISTLQYNQFFDNTIVKYKIFWTNFKTKFSDIIVDEVGVLTYEDKYYDYVATLKCINNNNNTITIILSEIQLDEIINTSVNVTGDIKIQGDAYFADSNNNISMYIDTENKFIGINSLEAINEYNTSIINVKYSSLKLSNQSMIVSSDLYPNLVAERNSISEYNVDTSQPILQYFAPLAPVSLRRTSFKYTFNELYENAIKHTNDKSINIALPQGTITMSGLSTTEKPIYTQYRSGVSTSYEIKDINGGTDILGRTFMNIDKIDENNTIKGGFGIQVNDINNNSKYRDILYLDNDSKLSVNSIMLGGYLLEVDGSGNLLFNGKKVTLT